MPVPFGFGISDFAAVGQLAWKVYLSYQAAPKDFETISTELQQLICVLDEAAETQLSHPLTPRREARLNTILAGFSSVLHDLQYVVGKYESLGTHNRSAWDQLKFGNEDISEIRSRLVMQMQFLTTFRSIVIGTMTFEGETLSRREYGSWQWVVELPGPEGHESPTISTTSSILDKSFSRSGTGATTLVDVQPVGISPPPQSRSRPWPFASGSSNRGKRLISAIDSKKLNKALVTLNDESTTDILDQELLDQALWSAARFPSMPLMEALVERGANVDAVRKEKNVEKNVLCNAVTANNEDAVHFLLSKKVNLKIDHLSHNALPLRAALKLRSDSMMSLLAENGAPINTEYQVAAVLHLNILQEAISQGQDSIAQILLNNGAKVDACSSSRGTALMIALSIGREAIAKRLIQKGANVNFTRSASELCPYTNPVEAAILGRNPSLLELLFRAGAVTNMPQAMRFAQANSDYPFNPRMASQYDNDHDGTMRFYEVMIMLAQRDLRYICYFSKGDRVEVKMQGIWKMMNELSM